LTKLSYQPFEFISIKRPVDRIDYIVEICRRKKILDLGCLDETALLKKNTPLWLHSRIAEVGLNTIGVDNSLSLPDEGLCLENSKILKGDITDRNIISGLDIDVVVAGELIEHLPNTLRFFKMLKEVYPGKCLICSTPNATNFSNLLLGVFRRESTHCDHLNIYSFKTLCILSDKANFSKYSIIPYHVKYSEMILRNKGTSRLFLIILERIVNLIETICPFYSGGYILDVIL
jgi:SAM-dependent methyltransferase